VSIRTLRHFDEKARMFVPAGTRINAYVAGTGTILGYWECVEPEDGGIWRSVL
jgi:hypothetical protein